ncbi:hypothetical protein D3C72_1654930 [compost metagenome]
MTVDRKDCVLFFPSILIHIGYLFKVLKGCTKTVGIRKIHNFRPRFDHRIGHLNQEIIVCAASIFGKKLYFITFIRRISHHFISFRQDYLTSGIKLMFNMNVRCSNSELNPCHLCLNQGRRGLFNIFPIGPS